MQHDKIHRKARNITELMGQVRCTHLDMELLCQPHIGRHKLGLLKINDVNQVHTKILYSYRCVRAKSVST